MFIRTRENYREAFKAILRLKRDLRIFLSTLFNILVGTYLERELYYTMGELLRAVFDGSHKIQHHRFR